MARRLALSSALAIVLLQHGPALAGGIDNKSNHSAAYMRTFCRNHATDGADAAVYNPAGLVKLDDGLYVELNNQFVLKIFAHQLNQVEFEDTKPVLLYPSAFVAFKWWDLAAFFAFTVVAGGGTVEYPDGTATSVGYLNAFEPKTLAFPSMAGLFRGDPQLHDVIQQVDASSMALGFSLGGAYEIHEKISVAAAARIVVGSATAAFKLGYGQSVVNTIADIGGRNRADFLFDAEYADEALGFGGVFGIHITPTEGLNIGLRYETETGLEYERSVTIDGSVAINDSLRQALIRFGQDPAQQIATVQQSLITEASAALGDGQKYKRNLPATLGIGVSYDLLPELTAAWSLNYYVQTQADWQYLTWGQVDKASGLADAWDSSLAVEYALLPELKMSLGYIYTYLGIEDGNNYESYATYESPSLDSHGFALGASWEIADGLFGQLGVSYVYYVPQEVEPQVEMTRHVWDIGLGFAYKIL